jgi:hypothetical protein
MFQILTENLSKASGIKLPKFWPLPGQALMVLMLWSHLS